MLIRFRATHMLAVLGLLAFAPLAHATPLLSEEFDDITTLPGAGWAAINNSTPGGTTGWFQGNPAIFGSQAGAPDAYIAANFNNAGEGGDISNWLLTPELVSLQNGDTLTFWTRTVPVNDDAGDNFPDRLNVWFGSGTDLTSFTSLLTINPDLAIDGYPREWTPYTVTLSGLGGPVSGRFAFEYSVTDTSVNANYIGIDTVSVDSAVPEPGTLLLLSTGLALLRRRRQSR